MRLFLLLFVVGCGTDTFSSPDGGDAAAGGDGATLDGGWPGCKPPCQQLAAIEFPVCLGGFTSGANYATDKAPYVVGRVDKVSFDSTTAMLPGAAADCTMLGGSVLVAAQSGNILTYDATSLATRANYANGSTPNKRIVARFLAPQYVTGIKSDGIWGCDSMQVCKGLVPNGNFVGLATDGLYVYWGVLNDGLFRIATNAAAQPEKITSVVATTALTQDFNKLVYANASDGNIYGVTAMPGAQASKLVSNQVEVRWIETDLGAMYWIAGDKIMRAHKDGGSVTMYVSGQASPVRLMTDDSFLYWINHAAKAAGGGLFRVPK